MQPQIKYFKAWLIFFILSTLVGFLVGGTLGGITGYSLTKLGFSIKAIRITARTLGLITGIPISYIFFRWSVSKYIIPQIPKENKNCSELNNHSL